MEEAAWRRKWSRGMEEEGLRRGRGRAAAGAEEQVMYGRKTEGMLSQFFFDRKKVNRLIDQSSSLKGTMHIIKNKYI